VRFCDLGDGPLRRSCAGLGRACADSHHAFPLFIDSVSKHSGDPYGNGEDSIFRNLGKWMESKGIGNAADVEHLFIALNNAVAQKDEALMVGHSYFMQEQAVDEKWFSPELLRFTWDYYIMPLIAEQ
jgi:hypothetical protein